MQRGLFFLRELQFHTHFLSLILHFLFLAILDDHKGSGGRHTFVSTLALIDSQALGCIVPSEGDTAAFALFVLVSMTIIFIKDESGISARIDVQFDRCISFVCGILSSVK